MKRNALIFIFVFCYAILFCVTPQLSPPSAVRSQVEGFSETAKALKNNEPGAVNRAIADLRECKSGLLEFDEAVKSRDKKIAELEESLRECSDKVASYAQGTGFKLGVEWLAGITIVFLVLILVIYLVVTGKLRIPFIGS
ncbi:hypothetical protein LEP1GSC170_1484 [Leptospira interrogans serovar Bataviae str. HAI135]|nr:hypothetical protein LEP1GSC170_1484 [Leptospira interrogans serovar Bataviae str. HAI135]